MLQSVCMYEGPGSLVSYEFSQIISSYSFWAWRYNSFRVSYFVDFTEKKTRLHYQSIRSSLYYLWSSSRYDCRIYEFRARISSLSLSAVFFFFFAIVNTRTDNLLEIFRNRILNQISICIKLSRELKTYSVIRNYSVSYMGLRSYIVTSIVSPCRSNSKVQRAYHLSYIFRFSAFFSVNTKIIASTHVFLSQQWLPTPEVYFDFLTIKCR